MSWDAAKTEALLARYNDAWNALTFLSEIGAG